MTELLNVFLEISFIFVLNYVIYGIQTFYIRNRQTFSIIDNSNSKPHHALHIENFIFIAIEELIRQFILFNLQI